MDAELLRKSVKLALAVFVTAAIATYFERIEFVWYPLLAVVIVVDDDDEKTVVAARGRILGTVTGGLVTFLVHTILSGWIGVLVSILLMVPVMRALGWQSGLSTAALVSVMFLMIPGHAELNWNYVFNRAVDTSVGCVVALVVGLWMWPRNRLLLLSRGDAALRQRFLAQLQAYRDWLGGQGARPGPLAQAGVSADLERMELWQQLESRGPHRRLLRAQRWRQRLLLWRRLQFHWMQWERLLVAAGPGQPLAQSVECLSDLIAGQPPAIPAAELLQGWRRSALGSASPLAALALAEELTPILDTLHSQRLLPPLPRAQLR